MIALGWHIPDSYTPCVDSNGHRLNRDGHMSESSLKRHISIENLELSGLRALVAVSAEGSLLGAAGVLETSRGTLRRRLEQLEAAVGLPLYRQGARQIHLTTAGSVLVERAQELFGVLRSTLEDVHAAADAPLHAQRVLVPDGLPPTLATTMILAALTRSPGLRLELDCARDPLLEDISAYDLILHLGASPERGFLVTRQIVAVPEILVASKAYLSAHGTPTHPEALREHRLLSWMPPGEPIDRWVTEDSQLLVVTPAVVSSDIHLIRHLAYAGGGIARLLEGGIPVPEDARLVRLLPESFSRTIPMRFLIPDGLHRTPRMRQVIQLLDEMGLSLGLELPS